MICVKTGFFRNQSYKRIELREQLYSSEGDGLRRGMLKHLHCITGSERPQEPPLS